ncbi:MAG: tryptophan halogenase family protein [Pseudomonadota bacterium]
MSDSPKPPKTVLIIGGGTAGWMSAVSLATAWADFDVDITLMESATIGIIGVGEGSTPKMRRYFDNLGISESEWMPQCNATYKCGIRFPNWATKKGYRSYYHPFFSLSDEQSVRAFFHNTTLRNRNINVHAHPDAFFISQFLAKNHRAPLPDKASGYEADYAYHFDANLIGQFLKDKAIQLGVNHVIDTVNEVRQDEHGNISHVVTGDHADIHAEFFIDCTGFASLLIGKTLEVPYLSYANLLFNDAAVAIPSALPEDNSLPSETQSAALSSGWAWKIPLTNRFGNGYVYSSAHLDKEAAERELRAHVGLEDKDVEARHLRMRVGRVETAWQKNVLAVGLSQGFIEPLEATALMIVQETIENFIQGYAQGAFTDKYQSEFNQKINAIFDGIKDYVYLHYKLNTRDDSDYWIENRDNENTSDSLRQILDVWDRGGDLLAELKRQGGQLTYSPTSWYCILAGMGRFPRQPKKPKRNVEFNDPVQVSAYCKRMLRHFPDHREAVDANTENS